MVENVAYVLSGKSNKDLIPSKIFIYQNFLKELISDL